MITPTMPDEHEMYDAVLRRDSTYDGVFVVAVKTTSIFCRPVCPARKPKRDNVEFFATAGEALHAGYRPCKRCRPMDGPNAVPDWVKRLLDDVDAHPTRRRSDADLRTMNIDPARARRYFKRRYGMTFHAYQRARRMGMALKDVRRNGSANGTAYAHGYESESGFRDAFARVFGRPPGRSSEVRCLLARWIDTPLGAMLGLADDDGLRLLEFVDRRGLERGIEMLRRRTSSVVVPGRHEHLDSIADELAGYFAGNLQQFSTPVVLDGSDFQVAVWRQLTAIPYGVTRSYSAMAKELGRDGAQRAIGRANGDNRLAIIVPCHRVVRRDGTLCGYGGGLWRKKWLLELEQSQRPCTAVDTIDADSKRAAASARYLQRRSGMR